MRVFFPLLVVASAGAHATHLSLDDIALPVPDDPRETLPSTEALQMMSLGYEVLVADSYWLRAISNYGDLEMHVRNYPNLVAFVERAVDLDPHFVGAYIFAGTALTTNKMDPHPSVEILQRGVRYRPDQWRIPFLLGFNSYYFLGDYDTAAWALALAAQQKDSPVYLEALASRISTQAGRPEIGLQLIDTLLNNVDDPKVREQYIEHRRRLLLEVHLRLLDQALDAYATATGRRAHTFAEVIAAGLLREVPPGPLGGTYFIDAGGHAATTSENERLRLPERAKGHR